MIMTVKYVNYCFDLINAFRGKGMLRRMSGAKARAPKHVVSFRNPLKWCVPEVVVCCYVTLLMSPRWLHCQ